MDDSADDEFTDEQFNQLLAALMKFMQMNPPVEAPKAVEAIEAVEAPEAPEAPKAAETHEAPPPVFAESMGLPSYLPFLSPHPPPPLPFLTPPPPPPMPFLTPPPPPSEEIPYLFAQHPASISYRMKTRRARMRLCGKTRRIH
jgi:hypothetical protein